MENDPQNEQLLIHKMLDVSSSHLCMKTFKWLRNQARSESASDFIVFAKEQYGYFIPIIDDDLDDDHAVQDSLPEDLKTVIDFARNRGCTWLMIDVDGAIINELPVFNGR